MLTRDFQKKELFQLLNTLSLKRGHFVLASGKTSPYYLDCRLTTLSARGSYLVGQLLYDKIQPLNLDSVGGMSLGADPIVSAITYCSASQGDALNGFLVRKEAKAHGAGNQIEGHIAPWMRIALVEDVVTTGGSTLKAIEAIRRVYPTVQIVKIFSLVNRNQGGDEAFAQLKIPYESLYNVQEFL
ncbi:MAG: orotate phosphoribosyltransferase [Cyanobacteria bacterium]|nr:orotate phosphoribosyltransferase [Cyanobacteriota bacterium]